MSETLRKPFSDQAKEKITPDSSKSTIDKATEGITNVADSMFSSLSRCGDGC